MLFFRLIIHHILSHKGVNLAVLFALSLGSGLLGSIPSFADATAQRALSASLGDAYPSVRNILVEAPPAILTTSLNGYITETLGDLLIERAIISNSRRNAHPSAPVIINQEEIKSDLASIWVWSFDKLNQHASLLEGEWPVVTAPKNQLEALKPPTLQAVLTKDVAVEFKLSIGDKLQDTSQIKYIITGIIQISDPDEDVWWKNNYLFRVTKEPGLNEDTIIIPVIIHPQSMKDNIPDFQSEWRYILDSNKINTGNVESVEEKLSNLKTRISANKAKMTSGLPNLLEGFRQNLATSRLVLYLLSVQAFLFVIFILILIASLLVDNSRGEIAIMISRGANNLQILFIFAFQVFLVALLAGLFLGPLFARLGLLSWSWISGDYLPSNLSIDTWMMSCLAAGIGWISVIVAIIPATRSNILSWQQSIGRPERLTFWQRKYLDIFLFIFSLLLFWQLSSSGSFIMRRFQGTNYADPLLLVGPTILLFAIAMLYLRLFPFLLRSLARLVKIGRGIVTPLGLIRIARNPQRLAWLILLISLSMGLILFARIFSEALNITQAQISRYQAGSDIRLDASKLISSHRFELSQVLPTSEVKRGRLQQKSGKGVVILAVDPDTFSQVSEYPPGMTNLTIDLIMQPLRELNSRNNVYQEDLDGTSNPFIDQKDATQAIPAIFSYSIVPNGAQIGDHAELLMAGQPVTFEIRGTIADFPTVSSDFVIVNEATFNSYAGESISKQLNKSELWLNTQGQNHAQIIVLPFVAAALLADAREILQTIQNNILTMGTIRAFGLNALILAIISLAGLVMINRFSIRNRVYEFSILRALGLSQVQFNQLLFGEGLLVLGLGLVSGITLGFGLTSIMRPYISLAVSRTLTGMVVHQVNIDWMSIAFSIIVMVLMYIIATLLIFFAMWKSEAHRIIRTGDE